MLSQRLFAPYMSFANLDDPETPWAVKVNDLMWGLSLLFHLSRPLPLRFPVACYSMSLLLLEAVGYWEVGDAGIGEDAHTALKIFYATDGAARTVPVFEAFLCQSVGGKSYPDRLWQRYKQAKRHALGHIDLGYMAWKSCTPSWVITKECAACPA